MSNPVALLALIAGTCALVQWLSWKVRLPSILFLLLAGIILGPLTGTLDPDALFGDLLFPFVSIAVAIILFEGGLTLDIKQIKGHGSVVRNLLTVGVFITWCSISALVHFLFGFDWPLACLFGAIGVVTGPTVIKPLLRTVRPREKIEYVLHWEGILVDPIGAFLAILVFEYILEASGGGATAQIMLVLLKLVAVGVVLGCAAGFALTAAIEKYLIPDFLKETITLISVIVAFAISESIQHEAGLLTVTIMGAWLGNAKNLRIEEVIHFKESLSIILISTLFILLAARLELDAVKQLGWGIVVFLLVVQFVIRPLSVWLCTLGSGWSWQEKVMLGWIAPRGIVAAAISSLFVIKLENESVAGAELLVPLAFVLIIGTVVVQSLSAKPIGNYLGVTNPAPNGVLIIGGNPVSFKLAEALHKEKVKVTIADRAWRNILTARSLGVGTYYGNPTSAHAEENLSLSGMGALVAMTRNPEMNALSVLHYRSYFGSDRVFTLAQKSESDGDEDTGFIELKESNYLFSDNVTYKILKQRVESGEQVRVFKIATDGVDFDEQLHKNDLPLVAIDPDGFTHLYGEGREFSVEQDWRVLYLTAEKSSDHSAANEVS